MLPDKTAELRVMISAIQLKQTSNPFITQLQSQCATKTVFSPQPQFIHRNERESIQQTWRRHELTGCQATLSSCVAVSSGAGRGRDSPVMTWGKDDHSYSLQHGGKRVRCYGKVGLIIEGLGPVITVERKVVLRSREDYVGFNVVLLMQAEEKKNKCNR